MPLQVQPAQVLVGKASAQVVQSKHELVPAATPPWSEADWLGPSPEQMLMCVEKQIAHVHAVLDGIGADDRVMQQFKLTGPKDRIQGGLLLPHLSFIQRWWAMPFLQH